MTLPMSEDDNAKRKPRVWLTGGIRAESLSVVQGGRLATV